MNPFEMVAVIVVAVMVASVLRAKYGHSRRSARLDPQEQAENIRLREEVKELKERLHVLERIATDKESSLAREIDDLRNR
jgi:Tfp pilus assembly protein PilN